MNKSVETFDDLQRNMEEAFKELTNNVRLTERPKLPVREPMEQDMLGRKKVIGLRNADSDVGVNPKDRIGAAKIDFSLIPTAGKIAEAKALMDGGSKYGPYNWRVEPVRARTYISAIERHLEDYKEGHEIASDSLIEHLGHIKACCSILIDAAVQGTLIDDRPINRIQERSLIDEANQWIKQNKPEGWGR